MDNSIKILYVCPWAHWSGHPPLMAKRECLSLVRMGFDVSLCTFSGVLDADWVGKMTHRMVLHKWFNRPLGILVRLENINSSTRSIAWFCEQLSTLLLAVSLKKEMSYDIIYLRDGDPFIFLPHVIGLCRRRLRWFISLIGILPLKNRHNWYNRFSSASFWKPIYRRSFARNRYLFYTENAHIRDFFERDFMNGTLAGKVALLPLPVGEKALPVNKLSVRERLGLPLDTPVFLHFGSLHPGKDIDAVLETVKKIPKVTLLIAGGVVPGINLREKVLQYEVDAQTIIHDYYIKEEDKAQYFAACDAVILAYKKTFVQTTSVLWEAVKFNCPVIASDAGELGSLVEEYELGYVFRAENTDSMKAALIKYIGLNDTQRQALTHNFDRFRQDYSEAEWENKCNRLLMELYSGDSSPENYRE